MTRRISWRKCIVFAAVLMVLIMLLFPRGNMRAYADGGSEEEKEFEDMLDDLLDSLDTEELQEFLDSLTQFGGISVKDRLRAVLTGDFALDYGSIFEASVALVWEEGKRMVPAFAVILIITLLCGILNAVKNSFLQSTMSDIIHFVSFISVGAVVLTVLLGLLETGFQTINSMRRQMEIVYPMLLTLMAASGGAVSVGIYRPAVAFMSSGIVALFSDIVLPSAVIVIVLTFIGNLSPEVRTDKLSDLFKSISKWLIGLTLGLFSLLLSVQGIAAAQYDGLSLRAVKYIISGSVPIVGGFLSGGVDLVIAGSAVIKNALGAFALFLLAGTILKPVLLFAAFQFFLRISAAVTEPVSGKVSAFLSGLAKDSGYFLAALLAIAFLYFLTLILLICSSGVIL